MTIAKNRIEAAFIVPQRRNLVAAAAGTSNPKKDSKICYKIIAMVIIIM